MNAAASSGGDMGYAFLGPIYPNYHASDANDSFSVQITINNPKKPVLAFGYKLSAVHRHAASTPVTASANYNDTKTVGYHYGKTGVSASHYFHWSCLTKSGAQGYLNGTFVYRHYVNANVTLKATITIQFTAGIQSWPNG